MRFMFVLFFSIYPAYRWHCILTYRMPFYISLKRFLFCSPVHNCKLLLNKQQHQKLCCVNNGDEYKILERKNVCTLITIQLIWKSSLTKPGTTPCAREITKYWKIIACIHYHRAAAWLKFTMKILSLSWLHWWQLLLRYDSYGLLKLFEIFFM